VIQETIGPKLITQPHRRYNALLDEWILVSAERTKRPWKGGKEVALVSEMPAYDPSCYLCPGNARVGGERNPRYESTFVFTNDFAALRPDAPEASVEEGLLRARSERGTCHVICFSPRHDLSMSRMNDAQARQVVELWAAETRALGRDWKWVQVFENRGAAMGASNPHPHGQIWAGDDVPREGVKEETTQLRHFEATGRRLLLDYAEQEEGGLREVAGDEDWMVVVPFWAVWPFETLLIPRRPVARIPDMDDKQRDALAHRLTDLLRGYDRLFDQPFPYSMGWHQAPFDGKERPEWQLHAHFYPPLLQATVRKFMVGYELLSEPQRDITAELAAEQIRSAIAASKSVAQAKA
jgi:UDPglucose--hexose-1-phosphate uridylyltransferase